MCSRLPLVLWSVFLFAFVFAAAFTLTSDTTPAVPDPCCEIIVNGEVICKGHWVQTGPNQGYCETRDDGTTNCEHWCKI